MVVFNFIGITRVRVAISSTIVDVNRYHFIFPFFRTSVFPRPILYLYVIFLIGYGVTWIVVYRNVRLIVNLLNRLRVVNRIPFDFLRAIRTMVDFTSPMRNINFNLTIMLSRSRQTIRVASNLFRLYVNRYLYTRLRWSALLYFRGTFAKVYSTIS